MILGSRTQTVHKMSLLNYMTNGLLSPCSFRVFLVFNQILQNSGFPCQDSQDNPQIFSSYIVKPTSWKRFRIISQAILLHFQHPLFLKKRLHLKVSKRGLLKIVFEGGLDLRNILLYFLAGRMILYPYRQQPPFLRFKVQKTRGTYHAECL